MSYLGDKPQEGWSVIRGRHVAHLIRQGGRLTMCGMSVWLHDWKNVNPDSPACRSCWRK